MTPPPFPKRYYVIHVWYLGFLMSQKEAGFQCRVASKQGTQAATKRKTIAKSSVFPDILRLTDTVSLMSFFFYNIRKTYAGPAELGL